MNIEQPPGCNDVLIGHTTICEASYLFSETLHTVPNQRSDHFPRHIYRLLEFFSLVEAIVLHDTLFTLPGILPRDAGRLELRKRLLDAEILKEYPSSTYWKEVIPAIVRSIVNGESLSGRDQKEVFNDPDSTVTTPLVDKLLNISTGDNDEELWTAYYQAQYMRQLGPVEVENRSIERLTHQLQRGELFGEDSVFKGIDNPILEALFTTGSYGNSVFSLRSLLYWQVGDRIRLPWYPDVMRVPLLLALNKCLRASLTTQVYSVVAEAFGTTVDELLKEDLPYEAVMPPLGALLLSRCSKREDLIDELFNLRDEFADFRRAFRELEQHRRNSKSIKELRNVRAKIANLLKAVAAKYNEPDQSIIETALGYAPDVLNVLANPLDPGRYKSELLKKPYEWLKDWWYRRPASRLFSVTKKLERLELYGKLVPRVFGFDIKAKDATFIREYDSKIRLLLTPSESKETETS